VSAPVSTCPLLLLSHPHSGHPSVETRATRSHFPTSQPGAGLPRTPSLTDTPIEIAQPYEYWVHGCAQWPAVQSQPSSSNLNRHIDVRDQMKQVKIHPHLLPFLLNKFNKETATILLTEETPMNYYEDQLFYDGPRTLVWANNVAQLQHKVKFMHEAATQLVSGWPITAPHHD
jgi:hypothetical protein